MGTTGPLLAWCFRSRPGLRLELRLRLRVVLMHPRVAAGSPSAMAVRANQQPSQKQRSVHRSGLVGYAVDAAFPVVALLAGLALAGFPGTERGCPPRAQNVLRARPNSSG